MNNKEYKISKTAAKTAKENGLTIADGLCFSKEKRIFDFSLLDDLHIPECEKDAIKEEAIKNISASNKMTFHPKTFDMFHWCDDETYFTTHMIYSSATWKRMYCIFQLSGIKHYSVHRENVWEDGKVTEYKLGKSNMRTREIMV